MVLDFREEQSVEVAQVLKRPRGSFGSAGIQPHQLTYHRFSLGSSEDDISNADAKIRLSLVIWCAGALHPVRQLHGESYVLTNGVLVLISLNHYDAPCL